MGAGNLAAFDRFVLCHLLLGLCCLALCGCVLLAEFGCGDAPVGLATYLAANPALCALAVWALLLAGFFLLFAAHLLSHHLRGTTLNEGAKYDQVAEECAAQLRRLKTVLAAEPLSADALRRAQSDFRLCARWAAWRRARLRGRGAAMRLLGLVAGEAVLEGF